MCTSSAGYVDNVGDMGPVANTSKLEELFWCYEQVDEDCEGWFVHYAGQIWPILGHDLDAILHKLRMLLPFRWLRLYDMVKLKPRCCGFERRKLKLERWGPGQEEYKQALHKNLLKDSPTRQDQLSKAMYEKEKEKEMLKHPET
jgi:hypothetical protein